MHRLPVSFEKNLFYNGQTVDEKDLKVEQNFNTSTISSTIYNHLGAGVIPETLIPNVLFDSDSLTAEQASILAAGEFDGQGIAAHAQPSDSQYGNQIAVTLSDSLVLGRKSIKVAIIGLDFEGELQIDRFYFYRNETQITRHHYTQILSVLFNDFKGNNLCSQALGGRIVISEATDLTISKDLIMASQDLEPNIFWRDWKLPNDILTLEEMLQDAIGSTYSVDSLEINTGDLEPQELPPDDVVLQIGQKFLATNTNIQKITLLLGIEKDTTAAAGDEFNWSGDLIFTLYALQTTINCPVDLVPELAIDFDPNPQPIAQISLDQESLRESGYVLTNIPQPVDFVLSGYKIGQSNIIENDKYYAFTLKRSGSADIGTLQLAIGRNSDTTTRLTIFNNVWVDVPESSLWFQVWTDAIKVSDGQGYHQGLGIDVPKTQLNTSTATLEDYFLGLKSLVSLGENQNNFAFITAINDQNTSIQNERSGSPQFTRQQNIPNLQLLSQTNYSTLLQTQEPLALGCVVDTNPRRNNATESIQNLPGLAQNNIFRVVNPVAELISLNLLGSTLIPNQSNADRAFRIAKSTLCQNLYGDVNGDGVIDQDDLNRLSELLGEGLSFTSTQNKIASHEIDTLELLRADVNGDGYITAEDFDLLSQYLARSINSFPAGSSFPHLQLTLENLVGRWDDFYQCGDGYDGYAKLDGYISDNLISISTLTAYEQEWYGVQPEPELEDDPVFTTVLFSSVVFSIEPVKIWRPEWVVIHPEVRKLLAVFPNPENLNEIVEEELCQETHPLIPTCPVGRNDYFIPGNILFNGELLRPDGYFYSVDLEIAQWVLELPVASLLTQHLDVFNKLIADKGDGFTSAGFNALKYASGQTVQLSDMALGKVQISAAIQSLYLARDGYFSDGYDIDIDYRLALNLDSTSGILTLETKGLNSDSVSAALRCKILLMVYLKQAGWNNSTQVLSAVEVSGLLFD